MDNKYYFSSPIGFLCICDNSEAVTSIYVLKSENFEQNSPSPIGLEASRQLQEYFQGKRTDFSFPIAPKGTEFQKKVWAALLKIPYGQTKTYGETAREIGNPKAVRAVGNACNKNPILIAIPCHRVLGANKRLTGYAAGLDKKEFLLSMEERVKII